VTRIRDIIIVIGCILLLAGAAWGQSSSLYNKQVRGISPRSGYARNSGQVRDAQELSHNPLLDETSLIAMPPPKPRKFKTHDLVTIIVLETKKFQTNAATRSERGFEFNSVLSNWFRFFNDNKLGAEPFPNGNPNIKYKLDAEIDNEGKLKRQDKLSYRIACEVIDVKPNGNLVLEATRRIYHDEEEITATLTGVCRSADVSPDNTVLSSKVANMDFTARHTGAMRDGTRRGWLTRLLDLVRPI
jgi:flagellar L-ring protein precursor FlgH